MAGVGTSYDSQNPIVENEVVETVNSVRKAKVRKINYVPIECFLCGAMENPKKMTSLAGSEKAQFREVTTFLKEMEEQDGSNIIDIYASKLYKNCSERVLKETSACFVCGEIVNDPRMKRSIADGRFKVLAMEERICFQGMDTKRDVNASDQSCFSCQRRINGIIQEEASGNAMKMKVVMQRSINMFIQTGMFVGQGSKICSNHLIGENIIQSLCNGLVAIERQIVIHPSEVVHWFNALRNEILRPKKVIYNEIDSFDDCDLVALTSLTKENFEDVFSTLESWRDSDRSKCHKVDLLCFLSKMRQGLSDEFLRAIFGYVTRQAVSSAVSRVRKGLVENFVQEKHFGLQAITREELIAKHVPDYAQELYNPSPSEKKLVLIIDGTYVYIPKSTNYRILRQTFCMHKGSHLVKPIMLVTPDGWIVDIHGPYFSDHKNNDAACLRDAMTDVNGLKNYLMRMDIILVDKGYDDVVQHLSEDHNLSVFMPKFLDKGKKQYTTDEANSTRLVTASRWVVEARNGHLKSKFAMFRSTVPMQHVKNVGDFVRIGCAIINAYSKPIKMSHATVTWAREMKAQSKKQNKLRKYVEENKLQGQRKNWEILDSQALPDFPQLSYDYLRKVTFGVYQIKLPRLYVQDKIQDENQYQFKVHEERPGFVRVTTKSRFSGSKKRNLFVLYKYPSLNQSLSQLYDKDDEGPILGWCCDCPNGARSLGCCAHVVSVLWYLGIARHQSNPFPANELLSVVKDCGQRPLPTIELNGLPKQIFEDAMGLEMNIQAEVIEVDCDSAQFYFDEAEEHDFREHFSDSVESDDFVELV